MRKILTFLFAALMSVGMWAGSGTCGPNLTWNLSGGVLTISGTGAMTNWSVSSKAPWYFDRGNITSVTIGNSVTSIGNFAFFDCTGMTSVTVGNSVTSIGEAAFQSCSGLTSVTIPNSVTSIGTSAFAQCGLTSITIPNSVTSIGEGAFNQCTGLTGELVIPNSVTSIGMGAFATCYGLTSMVVASGNTNYDSRDNCKAIIEKSSNTLIAGCKNTIIPNSVTSIGMGAFMGCTGLTSITIPNSVTSIEYGAFQVCFGLTSITIPNSVTSIGQAAFYWCSGLTSVTIGNSVTSIGETAFQKCSGLTSITIPNSVTSIGADAFRSCTNITDVYCYADPNNLTWNDDWCDDFKYADHATVCHVKACALATYEANWGGTTFDDNNTGVNVTFVGDQPGDCPAPTPTEVVLTAYPDPDHTSDYYTTFFDSSAKYALPSGVEAFIVTAVSGEVMQLQRIAVAGQTIPAGTAVILKSSVASFILTPSEADAVTFSANNSLRGVDVQTPNAEAPGYSEGCTIYVLFGTQEDGVGFYRYTGTSIVAHKAYVVVATSAQNAAPRRMPFIINSENTATDIEIIQPSNVSVQKIIRDGQLIILYEGKEYNAQGVQIK